MMTAVGVSGTRRRGTQLDFLEELVVNVYRLSLWCFTGKRTEFRSRFKKPGRTNQADL